MSMKKWLVALGIALLLAFSYFWSGTNPSNPDKQTASSPGTPVTRAEPPASAPIPDKQQADQPQHAEASSITEQPLPESARSAQSASAVENQAPKSEPAKKDEPAASEAAADQQPDQTVPVPPAPGEEPAPQAVEGESLDKPAAQQEEAVQKQPEAAKEEQPESKKDKYLTDPVPEGKPKPVEWQDVKINKKKELTATLSVSCSTILDNLETFNKDKVELLPEDCIIYKAQKVTFNEGESVFDVLLREMRKNKIHMEFMMTPMYNSNYVEGINNIYEFDGGELSGWMYKVNDWFPNYGSSRYMLKDGDVVEWVYTCDLGRDVGDTTLTGGKK